MKIHHNTTMLDLLGADTSGIALETLEHSINSVVLLSPTGRILTASAAATAGFGLTDRTALLGRHWCKIWPSWSHAPLAEAITRALAGKITTYWTTYPDQNGVHADWDVRISPVFDVQGEVSSVLAVSCPITKH